jgi:outer membrane protein insertion porin family
LTNVSLRESNLLGRGQDLRLGFTLAQTRQDIDLSFTEPYFLDRNVSAGFDVFHRLSDFSDQSSFEQRETGFAVRSGYQLTEDIRHNVRYTLREDEITEVEDTASRVVKSQEGTFITSSVSSSLFFNRLDQRFNPTDGYFVRYDIDLAGLGGDVHYARNTIGAGYFRPMFGDLIFGLDGEMSHIIGFGEDIRLVDRFFLGGDDLRGFESAGVGPRDLSTDDAIGGNIKAFGTVSVDFPLGLPEEVGIRGNIFSDFGVLTDSEDSGADLTDTGTLRASIGIGFGWRSPFGPIRLDLAKALVKEDHDKTEVLRFSFGTRF